VTRAQRAKWLPIFYEEAFKAFAETDLAKRREKTARLAAATVCVIKYFDGEKHERD
jgi:hypothetical protein